MLEESRKKGASIFVYLIFCLLIAIFVINFGPQGGGSGNGSGCSGGDNTILTVDNEDASQTAWHIAYSNQYNRGAGKQKTYVALETMIRREILAQAALARGLRATDDMIDDQIKKGRFFIGGQKATIPGAIEDVDNEKFYNHKAVRAWVQQLNVSLNSYREEQKRSLLASMMADILSDSVQVSRDEALQHYLFENNTVQYDVVAFRPEAYRTAMKLTDADVERFLSTHGAEVEARYKADERTYKGVKPQLQLRQIFIAKLEEKKPEAATPPSPSPDQGSAAPAEPKKDDKAAAAAKKDEKKDEKKAAKPEEKPVGMPIDEAKAKLEAVRAAVGAGKQKFADAAKQLNTDEAMKNSGGDLGWRTADSAMLGDKAVTDAVKTLKAGEMTPVITTDRGAYLVIAEAKREGDLTFDQVKHEIAKELARDVWSKEAAKRAAIAALDKARSGLGLNLDQMYEKEKAPESPGMDIQQLLNDPNMSDEDKKRLLEMIMQQQGQKSGQIVWESKDIPAAWHAQADGAGSAPAGSAAAPKADAKAPAAGSAAPAATGSAAPAGAGSAATPAAPAPAPAATEIKPSSDQLPEFGTVEKPTVARFGPAPRSSTMSGIGSSKEAQRALFEELSPGMLAKQVFEGDGAFLVVQLISRTSPEVANFDKDADRLVAELRQSRAQAFLEDWMKERCEKLAKENKIRPNPGLLRETDDQGKVLPIGYHPCMSFR